MKILNNSVEKDGTGFCQVQCEEPEDLWHIYNLIQVGDRVKTKTYRKVISEGATGSTKSKKVMTVCTLRIEEVSFEPTEGLLRLRGVNTEPNSTMKIGQYHTFTVTDESMLFIFKNDWDTIHLEILRTASDIAAKADLAAVLLDEGVANICLLTGHMTVVRANITQAIPKKRRGSTAQHDKAVLRFFEAVMQALLQHVDFSLVTCCIVASPGFVKDDFLKYVFQQAAKRDIKILFANKQKFLLCHSTSAHKHALEEILADGKVAGAVVNTKAAAQVACLGRFFKLLNDAPDKAFYGYGHVMKAFEAGAIQVLLITDDLFRSPDVAERKKYVQLVEAVRKTGAEVQIFSTQHSTGEELAKICGVAAILKFAVVGVDEEVSSSDEEDEDPF